MSAGYFTGGGSERPASTRIVLAAETPTGPMYLYGWARGETTTRRNYLRVEEFVEPVRTVHHDVRTTIEWEPGWPVMRREHPGYDFPRGEVDAGRAQLGR